MTTAGMLVERNIIPPGLDTARAFEKRRRLEQYMQISRERGLLQEGGGS